MARDGTKSGGRPKGSKNKKTKELVKKVEASGLTPVEYLLSVMRDDKEDTSTRVDAANKVAPYVHPKLASVETKNKTDVNVTSGNEAIRELIESLEGENDSATT